jgi:hypothetical protein
MSASDLFTREAWSQIAPELRGTAKDWWDQHNEDLFELGKSEIEEIIDELHDGNPVDAKQRIAFHWAKNDRESWEAYRDGTTQQLTGIAERRVRLMEALEDLTARIARVIGKIVKRALF